MGDYVDDQGRGRSFTAAELGQVAHRLTRRADPSTSAAAAAKVAPELGKAQAWLLSRLRTWADRHFVMEFTDRELCHALPLWFDSLPKGLRTGSGIRTRRAELARAGLLELVRDGEGRVVKRQGCRVWRLK